MLQEWNPNNILLTLDNRPIFFVKIIDFVIDEKIADFNTGAF